MGKWNPKIMKRKMKESEEENALRIKEALKAKKLLKLIRSKGVLKDAILLFGNYKGEKISDLLGQFDTSPYVLNYLAQNQMIPIKTRKVVRKLIEHYDPFDSVVDKSGPSFVKVRDIVDDKDEIPW